MDSRPVYWVSIGGLDFGYDHPCGAVQATWDRDADVIYFHKEFREREMLTPNIASNLRKWGKWLPWAWPHDGNVRDKRLGSTLAAQFRDEGLNMLPIHAQFPNGTMSTEGGVTEMVERIGSGRLKVFESCFRLRDEMLSYHRKNGLLVKEGEDLISAGRCAVVMRRYACTAESTRWPTHAQMDEDPFDY
jgi:hypothetical protein